MRRLKCFIASAFDRDDVDKIYDGVILPLLKKMDIIPLRINRIEHNENIDQKIIELLKKCDFCISDLTYARPSVYYESGFAERNSPVIYIARKDHFRQKDSDVYGNLCIHFDLQKKNIIPWDTNSTSNFSIKLRKRITYVIKPILKKSLEKNKQRDEEYKFNKLSQDEKLSLLYQRTKRTLLSEKYVIEKGNINWVPSRFNISFWKIENGTLKIINACFELSSGVKLFKKIKQLIYFGTNYFQDRVERLRTNNLNKKFTFKIKSVNECWIIISLKKVNSIIMKNTFSYYKVIDENYISYKYDKKSIGLSYSYRRNFILISGFKSIPSFINEFEKKLLLYHKS